MTVLITGANSYIGKNLILFLQKKKIKYLGIDIKASQKYNISKGDILDEKFLDRFKNNNFNTIIHLAAMSNESLCAQNEKKAYEINVLGTINVINIAASLASFGRRDDTPNLPTNIIPTNIAWLKLSGKSPWAWEFHPFELRLCLSQTLWNPQC